MSSEEESTSTRRVFSMYVEQLVGDSEELQEAIVVRLRHFEEDVHSAIARLAANPAVVLDIVKGLSAVMQDLDAQAGMLSVARSHVASVRKWALIIPESGVLDD